MFPSISSLGVAATLLLPVSDTLPKLNVEPSCREAAKMGDSMDATLKSCMADEEEARARLEKEWAQFPASNRATCLATTRTGGGASYVEVLTCLEIARDASKLNKPSGG